MRKNYWFRVCACGTCSLAILGADAVGIRWSASAVEPRVEQYITLDDGLYALQADGTYSKVEGKRPQPHTHTHSGNHVHDQNGNHVHTHNGNHVHDQNGNHVHDHGTSVRPSGGGAQQNGKYLRLDDGLYVLQSDGTYMRAQDVPRPVSPGNRPNSNNQQAWQNGGRRPQQQWQDDGWDDDGNGWNQPQRQNGGRRPQPQQQWTDNRPVRPNRPSNNEDAAAFGNFIQGLSNAINQSQVRPPRPAPFVQPVQPQFVNPAPSVQPSINNQGGGSPSYDSPRRPSAPVQDRVNSQAGGTPSFDLSQGSP